MEDIQRRRLVLLSIAVFAIGGIVGGSFAYADFCIDYDNAVEQLIEKGWVITEDDRRNPFCQ